MKIPLKINLHWFIRYYFVFISILTIVTLAAASKFLYDKVYLTVVNPSFDISSEENGYSTLDLSLKKFNATIEKIEAKNKPRNYSNFKEIF
jgi:hypothetical protein